MAPPLPFRIFLSSPGDVAEDREAARSLLTSYERRHWLQGRVAIQLVAWDDPEAQVPLDINVNPQQSVNTYIGRPSQCDLTIVLLFGRLGTKLPHDVRQADGMPFMSGTHWEAHDAARHQKPVWVLRKRGYKIDPDDLEFPAKVEQYQNLKKFLASFHDADGALLGGNNEYSSSAELQTRLSQFLEAELTRRLNRASTLRVFLAEPNDALRAWRASVREELADNPSVEILPDIPPPTGLEEHAQRVQEVAQQADLCVHFVSDSPGAPIEEDGAAASVTYMAEQLRVCSEVASAQLILHPETFKVETVPAGSYQKLLAEALTKDLPRARLEVMASSRQKARVEVARRVRALAQGGGGSAARAAFVDVHEQDIGFIEEMYKFVAGRMRTVPTSVATRATPSQETFEDLVSQANYMIVVSGAVAQRWVRNRLEEAVKIALETQVRPSFGVYVRPGSTIPELPLYCRLIDNSQGFDPKPLEAFFLEG